MVAQSAGTTAVYSAETKDARRAGSKADKWVGCLAVRWDVQRAGRSVSLRVDSLAIHSVARMADCLAETLVSRRAGLWVGNSAASWAASKAARWGPLRAGHWAANWAGVSG